MDTSDKTISIYFHEDTEFVESLRIIKEIQQNLQDPEFRFSHSAIHTRREGEFYSGLEPSQVTVAVTSLAAFVKVLVEVLKTFKGTVEIERKGIRVKYEGHMTRAFTQKLLDLVKVDDKGSPKEGSQEVKNEK